MVLEERELYRYPGPPERWISGFIKPESSLEAKNDKTEVVLLGAHHEKAQFFEKDNNAEKKIGGSR